LKYGDGLVAAIVILFLPGYALLTLWPGDGSWPWGQKLLAALGVSLVVIPLLLLWGCTFHLAFTLGPSNNAAVTGACLMVRRELFWGLGGFDENLQVACSDVELCLRAIDKGYFNEVLPRVRLQHCETAARG
jgi:GT2 family glycosyltransferase